jgi:two-component system LytT family sensor kinase
MIAPAVARVSGRAQRWAAMNITQSGSSSRRAITAARWVLLLVFVVGAGLYARLPQPPEGVGPMFPRVPSAPDLRTLLALLGVGSVVWYAVFIALPFLLWAARQADGRKGSRVRTASIGVLVVTALIFVTSRIQFMITYAGAPSRPDFLDYLPQALQQNLLPWIALAGIVAAVESRRRAVALALEKERLRTGMVEQRLVTLTSQLQPHFLFNTLQGISTLIHRDPNAADQMLGKLADLLRDVLRDRDKLLIPLRDEVRYARTYLEIAKLRFGDRLSYEIDVPSELEQTSVPLFLLQPLVENALAHGLASRIEGGKVSVTATRAGDRIRIEVADDGGGLAADALHDGVGLSNTTERLNAAYGTDHTFELLPRSPGVTARIEIPSGATR